VATIDPDQVITIAKAFTLDTINRILQMAKKPSAKVNKIRKNAWEMGLHEGG
jgi:hypothetical protein